MSDRKHPERSALDPEWEDALRRGQEAEGDAGSVDAELAVVHLLRHARRPEGIDDDRLDAVWDTVVGEVAPTPWWKRPWMIWAPVAAAAAVTLIVIVKSPEAEPTVAVNEPAPQSDAAAPPAMESAREEGVGGEASAAEAVPQGAASAAAPQGNAALLERQFSLLEPKARAELGANIESQRGSLRYGLLDTAKGGGR
jgi:hypothetical protein